MYIAALRQFNTNINQIEELHALFTWLKSEQNITSTSIDDLLRSEIVYVVSALDKLIHDFIRIGMLASFNGRQAKTDAYLSFPISVRTLDNIRSSIYNPQTKAALTDLENDPEYVFEREINQKHAHASFQTPDNISKGLSLIWSENHKWQKITDAIKRGITDDINRGESPIIQEYYVKENYIKTELINIVNRRNAIVHQADTDPQTNEKRTIQAEDTLSSIQFIKKLGSAIFNCINPS